MDYAGLNYLEVQDLPMDIWHLLLHDAYIHRLNQSEKGQAYLNEAWILEQTKPDRKSLRKRFGKEVEMTHGG